MQRHRDERVWLKERLGREQIFKITGVKSVCEGVGKENKVYEMGEVMLERSVED